MIIKILQSAIEIEKIESESNLQITSPKQIQQLLDEESIIIKKIELKN